MINIPEKATERVRAIIIDSDKILLINRLKDNDSYWVIPGGAVEPGESHEQALKREFFYLCSVVGGKLGAGQGPEFQPGTEYEGEYNLKWVNLTKLRNLNLKPEEVKNKIIQLLK